jgi:CRP-like cAMP-binding protein
LIRIKLERVDLVQRVAQDPLLKTAELMRVCGPELLKQGVAQRYRARAALFRQSEQGESLFFVLSGEVRLYATGELDGSELGVVTAGEVVGEAEALSGLAPRCCSAIAAGEADAVELPRSALVPHLKALEKYLRGLHEQRRAKLTEMTDFLNRW